MRKFIGLNWKMNPATLREAKELAFVSRGIKKHEVVLFPPFPFIPVASKSGMKIGAQNFSIEKNGAHTGEISLSMLKSVGARYALVGHSERRTHFGETDVLVSKKFSASILAQVTPVLCVGEPWEIRKKGIRLAEAYIKRQIASVRIKTNNFIIAYEPVWAIGTGRACSPSDAVKMAEVIRGKMKDERLKIIYGGSVDARNIKAFLDEKEIDGVLVGGASSDIKKLRKLVATLNNA